MGPLRTTRGFCSDLGSMRMGALSETASPSRCIASSAPEGQSWGPGLPSGRVETPVHPDPKDMADSRSRCVEAFLMGVAIRIVQ